jgi:hypothetical protein
MQDELLARKVLARMKESKVFWNIRSHVAERVLAARGESLSLTALRRELAEAGVREELAQLCKNSQLKQQRSSPINEEPVEVIQTLRVKWADMLAKGTEGLITKLRRG